MIAYDLDFNQLTEVLKSNGIATFRAKQIWEWLYIHLVDSYDDMKNIDSKTKEFMKNNYPIEILEVVKSQSDDEGTTKVLFSLSDDEVIETVLMKQKYGYSICVTTQIGCKIGCSFCASHLGGFKRNLTPGEITGQLMHFSKQLKLKEERVSHVVVMGIGEPLDNLTNVFTFINTINDQKGLKIGARHITVSTSGIVPKIKEIANYDKQINLAISLHAPNDEIRSKIMKINDAYNIESLLDAVDDYIYETNRRVSFEYIMLKGINDQVEHAKELAKVIRGINCHVNLIPFNPVDEYTYQQSEVSTIKEFEKVLLDAKIQVSIRFSRGTKIDGACGQLRYKHNND